MKNKASLTMIEFVIMLLVFAFASALCLRAFSYAGKISDETALRDEAIIAVQNVAELLVYHGGDISSVNTAATSPSSGRWEIEYERFTISIVTTDSGSPLLESRRVIATGREGEILAEIPVSWQKEGAR